MRNGPSKTELSPGLEFEDLYEASKPSNVKLLKSLTDSIFNQLSALYYIESSYGKAMRD